MHLTFTSDLECSISERTISGKIVPFDGEIGQTSAGKVVFEKGSIEIPDSPKPKLLLEHDAKSQLVAWCLTEKMKMACMPHSK